MSGLLQLENEEFWSAPSKTKREVQRQLSKDGFRGVILDAPERMPLDGRQRLPVIGWRVTSFRESQRVSFHEFAIIAAVTQQGGETLAGRLYDPRNMDTSKMKGFKREDPGEGTTYKMFTFDVMERTGVPLVPDECLVTMIVQDLVSNRVASSLCKPLLAFSDPAVAAFLAERRPEGPASTQQPKAVHPPVDGTTSYQRSGGSPEPPADARIVLSPPAKAKRGSPCVLQASFRLPVPEGLEVGPDDEVGDGEAKAVLPLGLLLTGDRLPGPYLLQLQVPVYGAPHAQTRLAEGYLALDLNDHLRLPTQTYYAYALCGTVLAGPATFALEEA